MIYTPVSVSPARSSDLRGPGVREIERVFVAHYDDVYRAVLRLVHDPADARDLTQETFARAYEALPGFRGDSTLKTWLLRIAQHIVLDRFRQLARDRSRHLVPLDEDEETAAWPPAAAPDQQQASQRRESDLCVQRCVDHLADDYRQAVVLHDMAGLTNEEIARLLGVSLATVKIRVHRGRKRIRALAGEHCEVYRDERNELACQPKRPEKRDDH